MGAEATLVTLFAGGGLADIGAKAAGWQPVGAVEWDAAIAEVYARNHGPHITVAPVQDVDYRQFAGIDAGWASPCCTNASVANQDGEEDVSDRTSAEAVCRFLRDARPRVFALENVWAYRNFDSFKLICDELTRLGYRYRFDHLNSACWGVPQTRKRLILRARRDGKPVCYLEPTHAKEPVDSLFGRLQPWVGWYVAVEDLLPTLPESRFAEWQLRRLPEELKTCLVDCVHRTGAPLTTVNDDEPSFTVMSSHFRRPGNVARAFLVDGTDGSAFRAPEPVSCVTASLHAKTAMPRAWLVNKHDDKFGDGCRDGESPAFTVPALSANRYRAFMLDCQESGSKSELIIRNGDEPSFTTSAGPGARRPARAWLEQGRVVAMTPRALARFQSVPDSYWLPEKPALACRIIGNGAPPRLVQAVMESLR